MFLNGFGSCAEVFHDIGATSELTVGLIARSRFALAPQTDAANNGKSE